MAHKEDTTHKGYHGDGDSSIVLQHSKPSYWTVKHTILSTTAVVVFALLGYILVKVATK